MNISAKMITDHMAFFRNMHLTAFVLDKLCDYYYFFYKNNIHIFLFPIK